MNILFATVVTYNPDSKVVENILSYAQAVQNVIVVDNSEVEPTGFYKQLEKVPNSILIKNGDNLGIAEALNIASNKALELGSDWLLTMDQDSSFSQKNLTNYLTCINRLINKDIGLIGINYIDHLTGDIMAGGICIAKEVQTVITSGSIMNLMAFKRVGGFRKELFIDGVDDEYCYRLIKEGFPVLQLPLVYLNHSLGKDIVVRNWHLGKLVKRNVHSPQRMYYMTRNYIYLIKRYNKDFPGIKKKYLTELLVRGKNNLLYNSKRISVIKYIVRGIYDAIINRSGRLK